MRTTKTLLFVLLLVAATASSFAQSLTGSVAGVVKDESGGALPGASVSLAGKTGARTAVTDTTGKFRFLAVPPGAYEVTVALAGFQGVKRSGLQLTIGQNLSADFSLKVSSLTETLDVVGEAPVVDTTSNATNNAISQDLLFNMPISRTNAAVSLMNYAPGVNSGSAYGGDANSGSALTLDGVDTRDPDGGTAWTFFNYNIIEEVQIGGLGAPAEYGGFTGAVVNTVTRSGGNKWGALFDLNYSSGGLGSNNVSSKAAQDNPSLGDPAKTDKLLDTTVQLSGPVIKDKLFFFTSVQRYEFNSNPSGPNDKRLEYSPRLNGKLTWQPTQNDFLSTTIQYDAYNQRGRNGFAGINSTYEGSVNEDAPETVFALNYRHLFGPKTFLEVKFSGYDGYFDLNPEFNTPAHYDGDTAAYSGGGGYIGYYDRTRNQVNASVSHYAEGFGRHDLKFGVEIERSKLRNRYAYSPNPPGVYYYDYGGPYLAYSYGYDIQAKNSREAGFVQDTWRLNGRLTLNPGIRADFIRGYDGHDGNKMYDVTTWAPRIGAAFDLTGDAKTVLKAHWGQYYEGALKESFGRALSGTADTITYDVSGGYGDLVEIDRSSTSTYRIDPNIKHPRVDQFTIGLERALSSDFRLAVTGIFRKNKNSQGSVLPSARWEPTTVTNDLTGQPLTVYNWINQDESDADRLHTNPDGFQYLDESGKVIGTAKARRDYKALMVVLSKRLSKRWQAQASYVYSKVEGTIDNFGSSVFGYQRYFYETPTTAIVNADGPLTYDRPHEVKIFATYQVPRIDVGINAYYRYVSGRTYTAYQRFSGSAIDFPISSGGRSPNLEPKGSRRVDAESILDLRFDKMFKVGNRGDRFSVYCDIANAFNAGTVTRVVDRYPSLSIGGNSVDFEGARTVIAPRQVTLGARWSF
jgi:Carboxypeptidase regulatory-like domain/TonB dependent receptor-like, beta-barrel